MILFSGNGERRRIGLKAVLITRIPCLFWLMSSFAYCLLCAYWFCYSNSCNWAQKSSDRCRIVLSQHGMSWLCDLIRIPQSYHGFSLLASSFSRSLRIDSVANLSATSVVVAYVTSERLRNAPNNEWMLPRHRSPSFEFINRLTNSDLFTPRVFITLLNVSKYASYIFSKRPYELISPGGRDCLIRLIPRLNYFLHSTDSRGQYAPVRRSMYRSVNAGTSIFIMDECSV